MSIQAAQGDLFKAYTAYTHAIGEVWELNFRRLEQGHEPSRGRVVWNERLTDSLGNLEEIGMATLDIHVDGTPVSFQKELSRILLASDYAKEVSPELRGRLENYRWTFANSGLKKMALFGNHKPMAQEIASTALNAFREYVIHEWVSGSSLSEEGRLRIEKEYKEFSADNTTVRQLANGISGLLQRLRHSEIVLKPDAQKELDLSAMAHMMAASFSDQLVEEVSGDGRYAELAASPSNPEAVGIFQNMAHEASQCLRHAMGVLRYHPENPEKLALAQRVNDTAKELALALKAAGVRESFFQPLLQAGPEKGGRC